MNLNENLQLTNNAVEYVLQRELTAHARAVNLLRRQSNVSVYLGVYAKGDGVTDDSAAINFVVQNLGGGVIDGGGLTYKCNSPITGITSGTTIQNATFDFSDMPAQAGQDKCISVNGSKGTGVALTSNTAAGSAAIVVGDTSTFVADGLVWLESGASWDDLQSVTYGQYARVKSVDTSTALTLYAHVQMPFNTADTATIAPVTPAQNITFRNIRLIGAQANTQAGIYATYCEDLTVENCKFENVDYVSVALWRCYRSTIDGCRASFIRSAGNAYGYGVWAGCFGCSIVNSWGEDCRHTVTIGDNNGINMWTRVVGCHAINSKDAGFDSHSASMWTTFEACHVLMSAAQFLTSSHDGIIMQGLHGTVVNCHVYGFKGAGIIVQPLTKSGIASTVVVKGNTLVADAAGYGSGAQGHGVYVTLSATYGGNVKSCIIEGNSIAGGTSNSIGFNAINFGVFTASAVAENIVIANNRCEDSAVTYAALVRTNGASSSISGVKLVNNFLESGGAQVVYVLADGTSSTISDVLIADNTIDGGTSQCLRVRNTGGGSITNVRERGNLYLNAVVKRSFETVTNWLADLSEEAPITVTASTVTVAALSDEYICNRAGTITVTLPAASDNPGRILRFKTIQAQQVDSASSNVVPIDSATAGTAILPATDGAWAQLKSDGSNWIVMAKG